MDGWCKVKGAARYCGLSERTIRHLLKCGLRYVRVGGNGAVLIRYEWIDQYLSKFEFDDNRVDEIVAGVMEGLESQ